MRLSNIYIYIVLMNNQIFFFNINSMNNYVRERRLILRMVTNIS